LGLMSIMITINIREDLEERMRVKVDNGPAPSLMSEPSACVTRKQSVRDLD
jgi:hypothetical protein